MTHAPCERTSGPALRDGKASHGLRGAPTPHRPRRPWSLRRLLQYAEESGFRSLSANDRLIFSRPWLDGSTALTAVLAVAGRMALATTVALPVVQGPVALAKSLAAIDVLSGVRLIVGVGPGSPRGDYAAVGVPFTERWERLDEAVWVLRALRHGEGHPFEGRFYSTGGIAPERRPVQRSGPPARTTIGSPTPSRPCFSTLRRTVPRRDGSSGTY